MAEELRERQPMRELILDMDSSVSETYGEQEGTAYNGYFNCMANTLRALLTAEPEEARSRQDCSAGEIKRALRTNEAS
jgi:hypothetical protein